MILNFFNSKFFVFLYYFLIWTLKIFINYRKPLCELNIQLYYTAQVLKLQLLQTDHYKLLKGQCFTVKLIISNYSSISVKAISFLSSEVSSEPSLNEQKTPTIKTLAIRQKLNAQFNGKVNPLLTLSAKVVPIVVGASILPKQLSEIPSKKTTQNKSFLSLNQNVSQN